MNRLSERPSTGSAGVRGWAAQAAESARGVGESESLTSWVRTRLTKALGPARAEAVLLDTLGRMNKSALENPKDLLAFAELLVRQGGLVMTVGCTFKIHAVLRGATEAT